MEYVERDSKKMGSLRGDQKRAARETERSRRVEMKTFQWTSPGLEAADPGVDLTAPRGCRPPSRPGPLFTRCVWRSGVHDEEVGRECGRWGARKGGGWDPDCLDWG